MKFARGTSLCHLRLAVLFVMISLLGYDAMSIYNY